MRYIPTCGVDSTTMVPIKVISIPKLPVATLTFRSPDAQMLGDGPSLLALKCGFGELFGPKSTTFGASPGEMELPEVRTLPAAHPLVTWMSPYVTMLPWTTPIILNLRTKSWFSRGSIHFGRQQCWVFDIEGMGFIINKSRWGLSHWL